MTTRTRIEVKQQGTENPGSLLKRFTRKISSSGILRAARSNRYHERNESELRKKRSAIRRIRRKAEKTKLWKLGKLAPKKRRR